MWSLRSLIHSIVLVHYFGSTDGLASFLVKTSETFKLADLQYAEASLQATARNYTASRLLLDRSTGSMLLTLNHVDQSTMHDITSLPSSLRRSDWIMEIFCSAKTQEDLVQTLRESYADTDTKNIKIKDGWVLDYIRFEDVDTPCEATKSTIRYTMKSLLCCVAQTIPTIPALDPQQRSSTLLLVDTKSATGDEVFFGQICFSSSSDDALLSPSSILSSHWAQRPFQYSSAINRKAAEIIMDWICDAISMRTTTTSTDMDPPPPPLPPLLFDPTCGSGTFLALGLERGLRVQGYDINPNCVEGSRQNLVYMFGEDQVQSLACIQCLDSTSSQSRNHSEDDTPAGVVANLPWGINTADYANENYRILQSIHHRLSNGTPCIFVTKTPESKLFLVTGYDVLAQVHIPPLGFKLPKSKKKDSVQDVDALNGRNSCVVTFASSLSR